MFPALEDGSTGHDLNEFRIRMREQKDLLEADEDVDVLKKAFGTFTKLQFVKLLRVVDPADRRFKEYVQNREGLEEFVERYWTPACSHSFHAIGRALLSTNVPWSRFYLPVLSAQSAEQLARERHTLQSLSILSARLTCLTLVFDDGDDLDGKIKDLSALFETVFTTAECMQAVHVGFPRNRPLNLPLEDVFHNVTWDKVSIDSNASLIGKCTNSVPCYQLVAFGVASWHLDANEIIKLVLRHREKLKGLRLRDVHLKEGSMWKDVLPILKNYMLRLQWVSLRRIGYVLQYDEMNGGGAEVPDDATLGISTSDSGEDDERDDEEDVEEGTSGRSNMESHVNGGVDADEDSDGHTDSDDDEHGPEANDTEFPDLNSPDSPTAAQWPNGTGRSFLESAEDLMDNGFSVSHRQRKAWEKWVIGS